MSVHMNSRTPRTDAAIKLVTPNETWVKIHFAQGLEEQMHETTATARQMQRELDEAKRRIGRMEAFIGRFLEPEDLGYTVNHICRDDAREALGRSRVESVTR